MTRQAEARLKVASRRQSGNDTRPASPAKWTSVDNVTRARPTQRRTYAPHLSSVEPTGANDATCQAIRFVRQQRSRDGIALVALDLARLYVGGGGTAIELLRHAGVRALRACAGTLRGAGSHVHERRLAAQERLTEYPEHL